jgi:hypothetical protein
MKREREGSVMVDLLNEVFRPGGFAQKLILNFVSHSNGNAIIVRRYSDSTYKTA